MVEFIKGKWYKGQSNDFYIKFSDLKNYASGYNYICYTERCYQKRYKKEEGSWANTEFEIYALNNPVTLEELQKFLPKGHPDLQLNTIIEVW